MPSLFIYGGSFDPVHHGHIGTAQAIYDYFTPDKILFVPCKQSVLKEKPPAEDKHRLAMLKLAMQDLHPQTAFAIDRYELESSAPSYMIDTLKHLRGHYPEHTAITLILGMDTFMQLDRWHSWKDLIKQANILLIPRPEQNKTQYNKALKDLLDQHQCEDKKTILQQASGCIVSFNAGHYPYSSTAIREGDSKTLKAACPTAVQDYIQKHGLYI